MTVIALPSNPSDDDTVSISDGRQLVRKNGAWRQKVGLISTPAPTPTPAPTTTVLPFDRYDLKKMDTTGEMDLSVSQVFSLNNRMGDQTTQLFISNAPSNRSMTIILEINGFNGTVIFPSETIWSNGVPTLSAGKAIVVLYWNGTTLIGSAGPSIPPQV